MRLLLPTLAAAVLAAGPAAAQTPAEPAPATSIAITQALIEKLGLRK